VRRGEYEDVQDFRKAYTEAAQCGSNDRTFLILYDAEGKHVLVLSLLFCRRVRIPEASFQISIKMRGKPLSVGLVKKMVPPSEEGWIAPHEVAMMAPQLTDRNGVW